MSIEVMSGGMASIDEYMQFQVMKQVNVQSTELTTGYFNANQYPEHILQIALIGFRFTGSTVTTFINEIFAFNEYRDAATINGTYSASSFASATIKKRIFERRVFIYYLKSKNFEWKFSVFLSDR